jgi:hypothetical protein
MKKAFLLSTILFIGLAAFSQEAKKRASPHDTLRAKDLSVTYGRPYKKGREIFGKLEAYGKVYRCGADEATQITFDKDVTFGDKPVKAGTYTLFVIPEEKQWTIILNGQLKQWGAYDYDKNKDKDVLQTVVPVKMLSAPVEQLTITRPAAGLTIAWDKTEVTVPVKG